MVDDRVATEQNRCFRVALSTSYTACILSPSHQQCSSLTSVTVPTRFLARNTQTSASFGHGESIQLLRPCTCSANYSVWCVYKLQAPKRKANVELDVHIESDLRPAKIGLHSAWRRVHRTAQRGGSLWRERRTLQSGTRSSWDDTSVVTSQLQLRLLQSKPRTIEFYVKRFFSLQSNFISSGLRSLQS